MAAWLPNYLHRRRLTIQEIRVDADLVNFPVLVRLTSANFNFANTTTSGNDVRFTAADGTTLLSYERERHDKAGSRAEYWVRVPSVSGTVNTDIFVYFRDDPAIPDGANPTAAWDANTLASWRLREASGAQVIDSTVNARHSVSNTLTSVEGRIGLGMNSNGTQFASFGDVLNFDWNNPWTADFWVRMSVDNTNMMLLGKQEVGGNWRGWMFWKTTTNRMNVSIVSVGGAASVEVESVNTIVVAGGWRHIIATYDGSGLAAGFRMFFDGVEQAITIMANTLGSNTTINANPFNIASRNNGNLPLNGQIDEVRISNVARTPAWIRASFHSGADTLLIYGAQETMVERFFSETFTITDSISTARIISRVFTEVITITDSISKRIFKTFTEVIGITDTIVKTTQKTLSEVMSIVDTISATRIIARTFTEVIGIMDTIRKEITKRFIEVFSIFDIISVGIKIIRKTLRLNSFITREANLKSSIVREINLKSLIK